VKILGFAGAVVLLVLAIAAALLAADVRGWRSTMTSDDALLASAPRSATWQPRTHLSSLAERVLGVSDDVRMRRALARFRETVNIVPRLDNAQQAALARSGAEQALAAVARNQPGPRASQAETLLGVLVFTDVQPLTDPFGGTPTIGTDQMQASLTDFQDAVRADPDNAVAKYDLELTLRALLAQGVRVGTGKRTGAGATGRHGAGGGAAGGGY
jgi:hypothetical protein